MAALPDEILLSLNDRFPCRNLQIRQLTALLNPSQPSPSSLVIYGLPSTGKSSITQSVLEDLCTPHAYINCAECVTMRYLFEKTASTALEVLHDVGEQRRRQKNLGKCENVAALSAQLQYILDGHNRKFVLVLDGIDRQREASPTLLPALARLGETIPNLTIAMILSSPSPRPLLFLSASIPHIHFPPYTHKEALTIALASPPPLPDHPPESSSVSSLNLATAAQRFYAPFLSTLLTALIMPTTSLILPTLQSATSKLWPLFIAPILANEAPPGLSNPSEWDFPRLLLRNRSLFQTESTLQDRLIPIASVISNDQNNENSTTEPAATSSNPPRSTMSSTKPPPPPPPPPLLPYLPTLTLLSALLASTVPPRQDITIFSTHSNARKRSIRRRRSNNNNTSTTSTTSTPTKSPSHRVSKPSTSSTTIMATATASLSRPFPLDRLTAILRTFIVPSDLASADKRRKRPDGNHSPATASEPSISDLVNAELPTLERLRLVVPASSTSASAASGMLGDGSGGGGGMKYRVNVSKEFVKTLARDWGLDGDWRGWEDAGVF